MVRQNRRGLTLVEVVVLLVLAGFLLMLLVPECNRDQRAGAVAASA